jgi:hypothetical protein
MLLIATAAYGSRSRTMSRCFATSACPAKHSVLGEIAVETYYVRSLVAA